MPQQTSFSVENNFTRGLITESTGLNFPENAATDCDNVTFTLIGDVLRREGIDIEVNANGFGLGSRTNSAINTYKWNNVGGDGNTQLMVVQVGSNLYFFSVTAATQSQPLTSQYLATANVNLLSFTAVGSGGFYDLTQEATFADGNGYLFVFHPNLEPLFCSYNPTTKVVTANVITMTIRDFVGIPDGFPVNQRPLPGVTTGEHVYNLLNQGWTKGGSWSTSANPATVISSTGSFSFTVGTGVSITVGDNCSSYISNVAGTTSWSGTVTAYTTATGAITINITSYSGVGQVIPIQWFIVQTNVGYISTWITATGTYPSNADVWWYFKDSTGAFTPSTTANNISLSTGNAPRGHILLNPFNQDRQTASGLGQYTFTVIKTNKRPSVGAWFQGRVWYAGINDSQQATGDAPFYSWSENIYFSQINISGTSQNFGNCFQTNDPTSQNLFDILPTDGGVIQIQGSGRIFKLFPTQNGMLVFAANGVWFITGSQGIGFSASDYTITKISAVETLSSTSFVDVLGLPYFWNEEGIYKVSVQQTGSLSVDAITVGTILSFYNNIPKQSKKFARGAYDPIGYVIQWIYKSANEISVTDRYQFDKILNFNTYNKSFFPYTVGTATSSTPYLHAVNYVQGPGGSTSPNPEFKYFMSYFSSSYVYAFADEHDTNYVDWGRISSTNYASHFTTGYKLRGMGIRKFQPQYVEVFSRTNGVPFGYNIQGLWNYANNSNSGKWTNAQSVNIYNPNYDFVLRRHKMRGNGLALQFKVTSIDGLPFDVIGWAAYETSNVGV